MIDVSQQSSKYELSPLGCDTLAASSTCALKSQRHIYMILCSNCEFASAMSECDTCSNDDKEYLFCQNCRLLHLRAEGNFNLAI